MGCCGGAQPGVTGAEKDRLLSNIVLFGDYFDPDVRTILCCLEYCGTKHTFEEIDTLIGKHTEASYLEINPTGQTPTIVNGDTTVIGGYQS
jgi:glutathione S-transferase